MAFIIGEKILVRGEHCIECTMCVPECPEQAIDDTAMYLDVGGYVSLKGVTISINVEKCTGCGDCIPVCPTSVFSYLDEPNPGGNNNGGEIIGGGNQPGQDSQDKDPCSQAAQPSLHATQLSQTNAVNSAFNAIGGINDGNEHGYVFGSQNGAIVSTDIQHGGPNNMTLNHNFENPVGSIHIHPANESPPSVGDVYSLIDAYNGHNTYTTYYVMNLDGTVYALVVTNPAAMNQFLQNYPYTQVPGHAPNFPPPLFDEWNDFDGNWEMSLSNILDKYQAGMALLKRDKQGNFKKVKIDTKKGPDGTIKNTQTSCP
ncbi:4Fe-4S dicluster domain-containing protein [Chryseobacterium sp. Tr-659]|uniref:4Fe-4S binding protein n=1 Tax=Chryseobacterium sp. Tr-659 TaxID=2608340 RepID=UPI00141EA938|nr:4Fe-4S binding protein [Chryseobacterium sp. Tr-659]NIF04934.1 4Fe-4S dicluster domain-containing protein [Chryseobacterium sp. Tr-659]